MLFCMIPMARWQLGVMVLLAGMTAWAQPVRVVRFAESEPFQMGTVVSRRILHPGNGAVHTTLNLSVSQPGSEFAQHIHDESSDAILVLEGQVKLRQGDSLRLFEGGECAFIPAGEVHGTITAGDGPAVMISFQNPPDLKLYSGARDSSRGGNAAPAGVITPGAVKYLHFREKDGEFLGAQHGAKGVTAAHYRLRAGQTLKAQVSGGGEAFLFVWKGALKAKTASGELQAGERDTIFLQGAAAVEAVAAADGVTEIIHVQAPPR